MTECSLFPAVVPEVDAVSLHFPHPASLLSRSTAGGELILKKMR